MLSPVGVRIPAGDNFYSVRHRIRLSEKCTALKNRLAIQTAPPHREAVPDVVDHPAKGVLFRLALAS